MVSVNNLGSCFGSSGPLSKDKNGERFNNNFPQLEVIDWVESQKMLADKLGIKKWTFSRWWKFRRNAVTSMGCKLS